MTFVWIVLAALVLFLVWAGARLRSRERSSGVDVRSERDRTSGRYEQGNS